MLISTFGLPYTEKAFYGSSVCGSNETFLEFAYLSNRLNKHVWFLKKKSVSSPNKCVKVDKLGMKHFLNGFGFQELARLNTELT